MGGFEIYGEAGFVSEEKVPLKKSFELGDTLRVKDAAWELGIRDTFSLMNKQCFIVDFSHIKWSDNIFLNFINPNVIDGKKFFPKRIPIKKEFIYLSKILLIEQKIKK